MSKGVKVVDFSALLVIEFQKDGDSGTAGPLSLGRITSIAVEIAGRIFYGLGVRCALILGMRW